MTEYTGKYMTYVFDEQDNLTVKDVTGQVFFIDGLFKREWLELMEVLNEHRIKINE